MRVSQVARPDSASKFCQLAEGNDVDLLDDVLGFGIVVKDGARHPIKARVVALHDATEGFAVALVRKPGELGVFQPFQIFRRSGA